MPLVHLYLGSLGTGGFTINVTVTSQSAAGDFNGDGLQDIILADYTASNNAGRGYVVFGKTTNTAITLSDITNGTGGFVVNGQNASDLLGYSVPITSGASGASGASGIGDINGDGLADVALGAPNANGGAGRTYIIFGKSTNTASF